MRDSSLWLFKTCLQTLPKGKEQIVAFSCKKKEVFVLPVVPNGK
jgi:hypothetical protein